MGFGARLKARREELGLLQSELGALLGITGSAIGNYENGVSSPRADILSRMFTVLNCDANYLFRDDLTELHDERLSGRETRLVTDYRSLDEHGQKVVDAVLNEERERLLAETGKSEAQAEIRYIRHYLTPAAAGFANPIEGEDYELIEAGAGVPKHADFCIDISGDSMEPYIKDGARVYVQRDASVREFSDVGVFFYDGAVLCKQFCVDNFGALYLLSANPRRADCNVRIKADASSTVVCFGKVILPKKLPRPKYV